VKKDRQKNRRYLGGGGIPAERFLRQQLVCGVHEVSSENKGFNKKRFK